MEDRKVNSITLNKIMINIQTVYTDRGFRGVQCMLHNGAWQEEWSRMGESWDIFGQIRWLSQMPEISVG